MSKGKLKKEDFWIGDKVILLKSRRYGIFMGVTSDNKIRINIEGKIVLTTFDNIQILEEESYKYPDWLFDENTENIQNKPLNPTINSVIDLHIEVLRPELKNSNSQRILDFQIKKCTEFINKSLQLKLPVITIICGKGEGVLKELIKHILNTNNQTKFVIEKNDGGALEVWFS